jgi:DNA-binding HxlR family transcriptional regulator
MHRRSFAEMECPIARAIDALGDAWTLLLLRTALLGVRRFQDFHDRLGIPPTTLTRKLQTLTDQGLLDKIPYDDRWPREEYRLTDKGLDVLPVLLAFAAWGNRWLAPDGAPLECVDAESDCVVDPVIADRTTGRVLVAGKVALRAGPGASRALRRALRQPIVLGDVA